MTEIIPFAFEDHLVRVVRREGDPWFVGRDVCHALHIGNESKALGDLDADERQDGVTCSDPMGREQRVIIVSEPGVYRLVFRSRKPEAERFKRWLAHDVLPALRKNGRFDMGKPDKPDDSVPESALFRLNLVREARLLFGNERARGLWRSLGLPQVPPAPPGPQDEARMCLRHLLDGQIVDDRPTVRRLIELALDDCEEERLLLVGAGIRVDPVGQTFLIANQHAGLERLFAGTEWSHGRHNRVLRRLIGARAGGPMRFNGHQRRGTLLAAEYLDEAKA